MRTLLCLALIVSAGGTFAAAADAKKAPAAAPKITYDEHVLPLLKDKCVSCHSQDKKRGGLVLNNYTRLMEGGSSGACVKVGDPDGSLLYKVCAHTGEPFMPPMSPKMPDAQLDILKKWIAGGAPENAGSKVVIPDRPKTDFTLSSAAKGKPAGPPPMPPATLSRTSLSKATRETAVTAIAASPWAPLLAVAGQKQVVLYNTDTLEPLGVLPFPEGTINVLKFSRNGSLLLAGGGRAGKSGRVVIWSVTKGERLFAVGDESDAVTAADISPDQTLVAIGSPSKMVRIFSTKDGKQTAEIKKHTDWVCALEFSPDGVLLATGDRSGGLFVWEAFTAREYHALKGPGGMVTEVSWRGDSNVVGVGSEDGSVRLYEMENGNQIRQWGAGGACLGMAYSKDGRILTVGRDRLTRLWDGNGGAQKNFEAMPDITLKTAFTHDAARVVSTDLTGQIGVWTVADAKRVGTLSANPPDTKALLAAAQADMAAKQKIYDPIAAKFKATEALLAKTNADAAAAQKAVTDTAAAQKAAQDKLNAANAAAINARNAATAAAQESKAKETLSAALAEAAAKVRVEAEKDKANAALQTASTRALALSGAASAEMLLAQKNVADMQATVRAVEPAVPPAQAALAVATAAAANAVKALPVAQAAQKAAQAAYAADKAAADKATADLNAAKAAVAKLTAASVVSK